MHAPEERHNIRNILFSRILDTLLFQPLTKLPLKGSSALTPYILFRLRVRSVHNIVIDSFCYAFQRVEVVVFIACQSSCQPISEHSEGIPCLPVLKKRLNLREVSVAYLKKLLYVFSMLGSRRERYSSRRSLLDFLQGLLTG